MLIDVFAALLSELKNERELDGPLNSLLWAMGLRNLNFVHGPFEFGKDFVAQANIDGTLHQYYIQSKGGDITSSEWRSSVFHQCETMVRTKIGPPGFDPALPRRLILAFNGEFHGQAGIVAKEYADDLLQNRNMVIEFWGRRRLSEMLAEHYTSAYRGFAENAQSYFSNLGAVFNYAEECFRGDFLWSRLETVTRRWLTTDSERGVHLALVEAFWLRQLLKQRGLGTHATLVTHGLARLVFAIAPSSPQLSRLVAQVYRNLILQDRDDFLSWYAGLSDSELPNGLVGPEPAQTFATGVRLAYLLELCSFSLLLDPDSACKDIAKKFISTVILMPCLSRPVSEDFAVAVPIVCIVCKRLGIDFVTWIKRLAVWGFDSNLPHPRATAESQICNLDPASRPTGRQPRTSFLLAALLDTASILTERELYEDLTNDAQAADLIPSVHLPLVESGIEQFLVGGNGIVQAHGGNFRDTWEGVDGWKNAGHHHKADFPTLMDAEGIYWLTAGASLLARDRWWLHSLRMEAQGPTGTIN